MTLTKGIVKHIATYLSPYGFTREGRTCGCGGCIIEEQIELNTSKQREVAEILGHEHIAKEIEDDYFA
jgi:hypothetical protein